MKKFISFILSIVLLCICCVGCGKNQIKRVAPLKRAYILAEKSNAYSLGLSAEFQSSFESKGGSVIMETFPANTKDFTDYFKNAVEKEANVIFAPNSVEVSENILKTAAELKVEIPILAGENFEDADILKALKGAELDVYFPASFDEADTSDEVANKFVKGFKDFLKSDKENKEMNGGDYTIKAVSALGFDAYNIALNAIRTAVKGKSEDITSADVANALWDIEYNGVTGNTSFDNNGDAIKDNAYIKKIAKNKFKFIKKQTITNYRKKGNAPDYSGADGIKLDTKNKKIIIGVYEPITGKYSKAGMQEYLGIKYANSLDNKVKIGSDEYDVELYLSDNCSDNNQAVTAASDIVKKNALITLGSYGYEMSVLASDTFSASNIPAIAVSCLKASVTENNNWYFRVCYLDSFEGTVMAQFAWTLIS